MKNIKPFSDFFKKDTPLVTETNTPVVETKTEVVAEAESKTKPEPKSSQQLVDDLISQFNKTLENAYKNYGRFNESEEMRSLPITTVDQLERELYRTKNGQEISDCLMELKEIKAKKLEEFEVSNDTQLLSEIERIEKLIAEFSGTDLRSNMNESRLMLTLKENIISPISWKEEDKNAISESVVEKLAKIEARAKKVIDNDSSVLESWNNKKSAVYNKWKKVYKLGSINEALKNNKK